MIGRTVLATLAGETVGRYRIHLLEPRESGRRTPPQAADFIAERGDGWSCRALSRDDLDRVEFDVLEV